MQAEANKFYRQMSAKEKPAHRTFHVSVFDSFSKKQVQVDFVGSHYDFMQMSREDFERDMLEKFKQLLKSVAL